MPKDKKQNNNAGIHIEGDQYGGVNIAGQINTDGRTFIVSTSGPLRIGSGDQTQVNGKKRT